MAWSDRLARLALGTACLTPLPLFAGCPTGPEDFTRGVYIVYDDASTAVIVRTADGLFVETTEFNDGSDGGAVYVSHMGYMQMELSDTTGGEVLPDSTITREFRLPREVLTPPGAQETFITEVLVTEPASDPVEDRIKFETGDYASDDYGGCIVRTLPLSVSFPDLSPDRTEDYDFLPDFGVAVFRGITEGGEVTYAVTPVSFSTEPPPL